MPIIRKSDAPIEQPETPDALGPYTAALYSDAGGLTQFGAFTETLPPGSRSSLKHWHVEEDEFVFVIEGKVLVHEGDTVTQIGAGDAACFPANAPAGHFLENTSDADVTYLVVGTRSPRDLVTYPDHDRRLTFDRATKTRIYHTLDGKPADAPQG
ncbi:putative cupin superfamily protein [Yoonia maricola]|uniref:Putative cupin superfamily protein n=1 Tax=Yoonia maricola TaxID=420999 RepID=A0A2M8W243_9RHOB|nr:cupin domain-containing protein [Yoonia maricola]PJI85001.1 putative cupin superfamily protein [Yoonia maricola]